MHFGLVKHRNDLWNPESLGALGPRQSAGWCLTLCVCCAGCALGPKEPWTSGASPLVGQSMALSI